MARIKIEEIIDHLSSDIRKALRDTVNEGVNNGSFDEHELFRIFKRKVRSKCSTWERVPDRYVEPE